MESLVKGQFREMEASLSESVKGLAVGSCYHLRPEKQEAGMMLLESINAGVREEEFKPRGRSQPCKHRPQPEERMGPDCFPPTLPASAVTFCQQSPLDTRWTGHPSDVVSLRIGFLSQGWTWEVGGNWKWTVQVSQGKECNVLFIYFFRLGWDRDGGGGKGKNSLNKWLLSWELKKKKDGPVRRGGKSKSWVSIVGDFLEDFSTFI